MNIFKKIFTILVFAITIYAQNVVSITTEIVDAITVKEALQESQDYLKHLEAQNKLKLTTEEKNWLLTKTRQLIYQQVENPAPTAIININNWLKIKNGLKNYIQMMHVKNATKVKFIKKKRHRVPMRRRSRREVEMHIKLNTAKKMIASQIKKTIDHPEDRKFLQQEIMKKIKKNTIRDGLIAPRIVNEITNQEIKNFKNLQKKFSGKTKSNNQIQQSMAIAIAQMSE